MALGDGREATSPAASQGQEGFVRGVDLDEAARAATAVIRQAGRLATDFFERRQTLSIQSKGAQDLVSEADRACEDLIVSLLARDFPDAAFLGEERGFQKEGDAIWVIDPIDGTANFLRGINLWCVSIGLLVGGDAVIGLVYDPIADELFSATKGGGAFLNGSPIRVSGETHIHRARVCVGFSYRRPVAPHARDIERLLNAHCEYLRLGSGALGMAYTAAGRFDGYWERHINVWDVCAGLALVGEAGGRANAFMAGDALTNGNEILATTPALFSSLADLLGR